MHCCTAVEAAYAWQCTGTASGACAPLGLVLRARPKELAKDVARKVLGIRRQVLPLAAARPVVGCR